MCRQLELKHECYLLVGQLLPTQNPKALRYTPARTVQLYEYRSTVLVDIDC